MGLRILIVMLFCTSAAQASGETACLMQIAYAESRGTAVDGLVAVMHASIRHAQKLKKHVCDITAKKKAVPDDLKAVYRAIAKGVINGSIPDLSKGADSWTAHIPKRGKITRMIGGNWFAIALDK